MLSRSKPVASLFAIAGFILFSPFVNSIASFSFFCEGESRLNSLDCAGLAVFDGMARPVFFVSEKKKKLLLTRKKISELCQQFRG